ncbi:response regulator [Paenibacillus hamazuiensis]|uniref:response regulator n=1 Tax=Paenibacillus hamazuiensis TaxID=2936508 RepID=UPI00200D04F2|nr:response regulator [Paenibacillus hamazuiensis]
MKTISRILIVDDEKPIRQWFEYVIRQYDEEFEIVGICSNGEEALHMYEQRRPDIIITDIRMPVMDGLELIRAVKDRGGAPQFLILSNYDHFEYVKKGLVMGARDYLLKAETADAEIIEALRNIRTHLGSRGQIGGAGSPEENAEIIEVLIRDYLRHNSLGHEPMQKIADYLFAASSRSKYILALSADHYTAWALHMTEAEKQANLSLLSKFIQDRVKMSFPISAAVQTDENEHVLIVERCDVGRSSITERLRDLCTNINGEISRRFDCTVSIGIGTAFESMEGMKQSYAEANEAKDYKFYSGPSGVHVFERHSRDGAARDRCLMSIHELIRTFQGSDRHAASHVLSVLDGILEEGRHGFPPQEAKKMIIRMLELLSHKLMEAAETSEIPRLLYDPEELLTIGEFKESFRDRVMMQLEAMLEAASRHMYRYSEATNRIIRYLHDHFSQKVDMAQLARLVHLNENYISQLFKKETGQSVTRFLLSIRMERAKQMLTGKRMKISEIAPEVGYASESHFCTVFKLYFGKSPKHLLEELRIAKQSLSTAKEEDNSKLKI